MCHETGEGTGAGRAGAPRAPRPVNFRDRQLGRPAEVFELRAVELMRRSYQTFPVHNSQHADARDAAYVRTA